MTGPRVTHECGMTAAVASSERWRDEAPSWCEAQAGRSLGPIPLNRWGTELSVRAVPW